MYVVTLGQFLAEGDVVPIARIGHHRGGYGRGADLPSTLHPAAPGCLGRIGHLCVVPRLRAEQPPVRGALGVLAHQVDADPDLAVAGLPSVPEY
jgi:hypothetical protein